MQHYATLMKAGSTAELAAASSLAVVAVPPVASGSGDGAYSLLVCIKEYDSHWFLLVSCCPLPSCV